MPKKMRAIRAAKPDGPFQVVELDVREPGPSEVREEAFTKVLQNRVRFRAVLVP
ncbi:MAG TPA: hypothetical protein VHC69_27280 [Polyangiaceae bacterium]|nr:hypothetical protein [Polyangiaceae bacterium]